MLRRMILVLLAAAALVLTGAVVAAPAGAAPVSTQAADGSARATVYNWGLVGIGVRRPYSSALGYDYVMAPHGAAAPVSGYYAGAGYCVYVWKKVQDASTGRWRWTYWNKRGIGVHYFASNANYALEARAGSC